MRQIAIYGKGGIGKSTISSNLAAAVAERGLKVLQVGCDPKKDSTKLLLHGITQNSILDMLQEDGEGLSRDQVVMNGFCNVECVEAGGPEPGIGCAGKGINLAIQLLKRLEVLDNPDLDVVIYDVLGDVVCGGFAMPIRQGYAKEVYVVTSGEPMALYAANNICKGLWNSRNAGARLAGVIGNSRNVEREGEILEAFAEKIGSRLVCFLPRDGMVLRAEVSKKTVIEHAPNSAMAGRLRELAGTVVTNDDLRVPRPLAVEELERLIAEIVLAEAQTAAPVTS